MGWFTFWRGAITAYLSWLQRIETARLTRQHIAWLAIAHVQAVDFTPDVVARVALFALTACKRDCFARSVFPYRSGSGAIAVILSIAVLLRRMGLMFNAVCKIPMQFFIGMLGALPFVFYQYEAGHAGVLLTKLNGGAHAERPARRDVQGQ